MSIDENWCSTWSVVSMEKIIHDGHYSHQMNNYCIWNRMPKYEKSDGIRTCFTRNWHIFILLVWTSTYKMHIDFGIPTLVWSSVQLVSEQLNLCLTLCCTNSVFPQFLRHIHAIDSYRPPTHRHGHLSMIPYYFKVVFFYEFCSWITLCRKGLYKFSFL